MLRGSGQVIGSVGYVPCLAPLEQIPELAISFESTALYTPEVGLFWAMEPRHRKQGYATEAAQAMIDYAFEALHLKRIIAMTEYANLASQGVMRKAGIQVYRNPSLEPPRMQIIGVAVNNRRRWL